MLSIDLDTDKTNGLSVTPEELWRHDQRRKETEAAILLRRSYHKAYKQRLQDLAALCDLETAAHGAPSSDTQRALARTQAGFWAAAFNGWDPPSNWRPGCPVAAGL